MIIFPFADDNAKKDFPFITLFLIIVNFLIFFGFALRNDYQVIVSIYGFTPNEFSWFTLFSSLFLHADFLHLLLNMWFFWLFGGSLEASLGKVCYLAIFIIGGLVAGIMHMVLVDVAGKSIPCIGASGAVSAVMGGYFIFFPRAKLKLFVWLWFWIKTFKCSAFVFLGLWFLQEFFLAALAGSVSEVIRLAYGAHIGGFIFGLCFAYMLKGFFLDSNQD